MRSLCSPSTRVPDFDEAEPTIPGLKPPWTPPPANSDYASYEVSYEVIAPPRPRQITATLGLPSLTTLCADFDDVEAFHG